MKVNSKYRQLNLVGRSTQSEKASDVLKGHFDLALVSPSWDRRCLCLTEATDVVFRKTIFLDFTTKDEHGYQARHSEQILAFLQAMGSEVVRIEGDSINIESMWTKISQSILGEARRLRRPLDVFIDLSTCPRYFSLGTCAMLLKLGHAKTICFQYAEGKYIPEERDHNLDYPFTSGHWRTIPVPYLFGSVEPTKRKYFLVSVGFEGNKTARVLSKEDPDRVSILFPSPAVQPGYEEQTRISNEPIIRDYAVPDQQIVNAPAGDAIAAWKNLQSASLENPRDEATSYLCSGTKPHALGLALRAICLEFPTVLYNLPERHTFVDVFATGIYWKYELQDTSVAAADRDDILENAYQR